MDIAIRREHIDIAGGHASATTINHTIPGPLVELWEGQKAVLRVTNHLDEDSSIHWHGILLPFKDSISLKPAERVSLLITAVECGRWAFHCHLLYHMEMGMFRVVRIREEA